jgi:D-threo-aldose 1-dehydrogenase
MPNLLEPTVRHERVSRLGFGTGGLLRIGSSRQRQSVLAAALDTGLTHFDTAPLYGFGEAERSLGRFLHGRRDRVTVTTKFGLYPSRLASRLLPLQRVGRRMVQVFPTFRRAMVRNSGALHSAPTFTAAAVRHSLEQSLRALQTDHVDFFLAHQASIDALPPEEVIGVLEELRRAGKILEFGVATDFERLPGVLSQRPQLSKVVQFDSDLLNGNAAKLEAGNQLLITYGFVNRSIATCRERLKHCNGADTDLSAADDDTLGGLLLRATVLANPLGSVLTQSSSPARIKRNAEAANSAGNDDRVHRLAELVGPPR